MKKALLLVTLLLATSSLGWAGACGFGTMADYTAAGFSCTIGDKLFSNFSYTASAQNAPLIGAGGVTVTPQTGAEEGFQFSSGWSVSFTGDPGAFQDSLIGYTVTATGSNSIVDAILSMAGDGVSGNGLVTVAETLTNGSFLFISHDSSSRVALDAATFAGVKSLDVAFKDITVSGGGTDATSGLPLTGTAAVSSVTNLFSQSTVPEPASMVLFGSGLMTLAGYIRRRQRKASK